MRVVSRNTTFKRIKSRLIKTDECISSAGLNKAIFYKEDGVEHQSILRKFIYEMTNKVRLDKCEYAKQSCNNKDCINPKHLIKVSYGSEEHTPLCGIRMGAVSYSRTGRHKKHYLKVRYSDGKEVNVNTVSGYKKILKEDPGATIVPRKPSQ